MTMQLALARELESMRKKACSACRVGVWPRREGFRASARFLAGADAYMTLTFFTKDYRKDFHVPPPLRWIIVMAWRCLGAIFRPCVLLVTIRGC